MSPIFTLVYTSRSISPIGETLLKDILVVSRANNLRDSITGFLTARQDYFLQLLEGPEQKVRELYSKIMADRRHTQVTLQGEAFSETRLSPHWSMGLVECDPTQPSSEDLLTVFEMGRGGKSYQDASSLRAILRMFSRHARTLDI